MTKRYIANRPFGGFETNQVVTDLPDYRIKELLEMGVIRESEGKTGAEPNSEQPTVETPNDEPAQTTTKPTARSRSKE